MSSYILDRNLPIASLAVKNDFAVSLSKASYKLGQALQPITIFKTEYNNFSVLDLNGMQHKQSNLYNDILFHHKERLVHEDRISLPEVTDETVDKLIVMDYLLKFSACYVEVPVFRVQGRKGDPNVVKQWSFDKFLATRNTKIISSWLGIDEDEAEKKYGKKVNSTEDKFLDGELKGFVKLVKDKEGGTKVSVPRKSFELKDISVTPVCVLNAFMYGVKDHLEDGILEFTYMKDNRSFRKLQTTLDQSIVMEFYKDVDFVSDNFRAVSLFAKSDDEDEDDGVFIVSPNQDRGYARVFELGSSIYDYSPIRALNINRIKEIKKVEKSEVDTSFIEVDINSVVPHFHTYLDKIFVTHPEVLLDFYRVLVGKDFKTDQTEHLRKCYYAIKEWVDSKNLVLSTTFRRWLHSFMIENPETFPDYIGKPVEKDSATDSSTFGVEEMDF